MLALLGEETSSQSALPVVKSQHDDDADGESKAHNMPVFHPIDLVGHTFLLEPQEDGQRFHARIVKAIENHEDNLNKDPECMQFLCSINDDALEEVMSYNEILAHIQCDEASDIVWKFCRITSSKITLTTRDLPTMS